MINNFDKLVKNTGTPVYWKSSRSRIFNFDAGFGTTEAKLLKMDVGFFSKEVKIWPCLEFSRIVQVPVLCNPIPHGMCRVWRKAAQN